MSGIGVVVNPRAGGNRRAGDRAARLGDVVGNVGWVRETASIDHLPEVIAECRRRAVDVIAVCGGDGTFTRTLSAMVQAYEGRALPSFLPLRAGTMNTVARCVGSPAWQPERMLAEIAAEYRRGRPLASTEHQLLCVNGAAFGFMVGAGVVVGFLRAYYAQSRQGGLGALGLLIRLSCSALVRGELARQAFEWFDAGLACDGALVPFERFSVVHASSIEEIGLGFRPTYRAREQPGRFHVFAGPIEARELVRCLGRIRRGVPTRSAQVHDVLAERLVLQFRRPSEYMIDGEIMPAAEQLVIEPGPILRIIRR